MDDEKLQDFEDDDDDDDVLVCTSANIEGGRNVLKK